MGISFKEHIAYRLGGDRQRSVSRRGANRDPFLERYAAHMGAFGVRTHALPGHITMAYGIDAALGDNLKFSLHVGEVCLTYLKAQY